MLSALRTGERVRGLTTAAGIWVTAAIGLLIGAGFWIVGVGLTILVALVIVGLRLISVHETDTGSEHEESAPR